MISVIDLTERKKAEEELRESEGRYRAVVEQAAEGIVLFDVNSKRVSEANVACQNLLGYTPEAILRLTLHDLGPYSRELSAYPARERGYLSRLPPPQSSAVDSGGSLPSRA